MRLLRVFVLLLIGAAVYLAQFIFEYRSLVPLFPHWLFVRFPTLYPLILQPPGDLLNLAVLLSACATFTFGFWAPLWEQPFLNSRDGRLITRFAKARSLRQWMALGCFALSITSIGWVVYQIVAVGAETALLHFVWAGGVLMHLIGAILLQPLRPKHRIITEQSAGVENQRLGRSGVIWPYFLGLLLAVGALSTWRLTADPPTVDAVTVAIGLQATALARGDETRLFLVDPHLTLQERMQPSIHQADEQPETDLFATSSVGALAPIASLTTALAWLVMGDTVLSLRLPGLVAALLALWGVWLFACEFFRRQSVAEKSLGEAPLLATTQTAELDDGQGSALLAAAFFAVAETTFYFSRTPLLLEVVAWGMLGCWALLYGLRSRDQVALGLSGVLIGWSALLYRGGLVFIVTGLLWLLYARGGIVQEAAARRFGRRPMASWLGMSLLWLLGVGATFAPQIALWVRLPTLFYQSWLHQASSPGILQKLESILLAFHLHGDNSEVWGNGAPLLHGLVAPIFLLGLGVAFFALNRWQGWLLGVWLGSGVLLATVMPGPAPYTPDLLPLLPAAVMVSALGVERLRWLLLQHLGRWCDQTLLFVLIGLVLWLGQTNWVAYHELMRSRTTEVVVIAGALYEAGAMPSFLVVDSTAQAEQLCQINLIHLFAMRAGQTCAQRVVTVAQLPEPSAAGGVQFLIRVQDNNLLQVIQGRYPDGIVQSKRDGWANPVLYVYRR